jgi:hypothetical protein
MSVASGPKRPLTKFEIRPVQSDNCLEVTKALDSHGRGALSHVISSFNNAEIVLLGRKVN